MERPQGAPTNNAHTAVGAASCRPPVQAKQQPATRFVIGIGINVNRPHEGAFERATYLSDAADGNAAALALQPIAEAVSSAVISACNAWQNANFDFALLATAYNRQLAIIGEDITVRDAQGSVVAAGIVQGVDAHGYLLLNNNDVIQTVTAGEVTLRS
jgi:biotin-(acetyl-CoA carboxylase) ligase